MPFLGRSLENEVAYVTGASSGIGASCAHRLGALGAKLVLGARRMDRLEEVAVRIRDDFPEADVTCLPLDVRDEASIDRFLADAAKQAPPPTVLVNNAGLAKGKDKIVDAKLEDWDLMLETNVRGLYAITRKVVPGMVERGAGDVVNIASVAGSEAYPGGSVYCATKAAVQIFGEVLRKETLGQGIRVMTFDPGLVDTEFSLVRLGDAEAAEHVYDGLTPLTGDDIADCVAFALTRPKHMCIDRMLILATDQAGATMAFRRPT